MLHVYINIIKAIKVGPAKMLSNGQLFIVILWIPNILPSRLQLATKHHMFSL